MKIFIIEDEPAIREELVQLLQKYGYQCDSSDDFHHIVQAALSSGANLILLDINLPYQDGFQVCREIRQKSNLPIIVLTSRNSDFDELMSLNIGADDYIAKPYNAQILLARIQKLLARTYEVQDNIVLTHKGLTLNLLKAEISYQGNKKSLTKNELGILRLLMVNKGNIIPRDAIIDELWQSEQFMQNKAPITLNDGQYLLNCNYNGTYRYVAAALQSHPEITVGGATLQRAEDKVLQETYIMTSVGNNDRGTLIVPDSVTASLEKDVNALLVQYKPDADSNEVLQKMIPIGLDSTHGYRYAEKNMMYETFYGLDALVSFLCCYIGLVFLLICAALLALKQLTETTDNVYRYGLLQKLGAGHRQINHTLFVQTVVFFAIPLVVAGVYSAFLIGKAMAVVEEFMNIHIATNIGLTIVLFLLVYGSYFFATYLSCKRIVTEQRELEV